MKLLKFKKGSEDMHTYLILLFSTTSIFKKKSFFSFILLEKELIFIFPSPLKSLIVTPLFSIDLFSSTVSTFKHPWEPVSTF